ncbi:MAG: hypothetical protein NTY00_04150 [Deltaproteobacteria bacterium]|nr:hypothetical protein [Deltaproteobacteria bacterium]
MSQKQIDAQIQNQGYHGENREDQVESLVTRQILIQEAQRLGIDKEESFRKALKLYYEQTLIKVLTDRKLASITVDVSEKDIDRYLSCFGKIYTFTETPVDKGEILKAQGRQHTALFDNLSESMCLLLSSLQLGESVSQFYTGTEISSIRLDKIEKEDAVKVVYDRDLARELLSNYKRSREMDLWMHMLHKNASVIVYDKEKKSHD